MLKLRPIQSSVQLQRATTTIKAASASASTSASASASSGTASGVFSGAIKATKGASRAMTPSNGYGNSITEGYVKLLVPQATRACAGARQMSKANGSSANASPAPAPGTPGGATKTIYDDVHSHSLVLNSLKQQRRDISAKASSGGDSSSAAGLDDKLFGRIEVIFGPMFAGKTTELLRRCQVAESAGRNIMVIKSSSDDRYSASEAVTHDGASRVC